MKSILVHIDSALLPEYTYIWKLFADYMGFRTEVVESNPHLTLSENDDADIRLSTLFREAYVRKEFDQRELFTHELLFRAEDGRPDFLATAFYLVNCLQEYNSTNTDKYGRFPASSSVQVRFNCLDKNIVADLFEKLRREVPLLSENTSLPQKPGRLFFSHDIDMLYGAWKEDGLYALKSARLHKIPGLLFRQFLGTPDWMNADKIIALERRYQVNSTFFWLCRKGFGLAGIPNADYSLDDQKVQDQIGMVRESGFGSGLHKAATSDSYEDELRDLGVSPFCNRNHFLKIKLPHTFNEIEEAGFKVDCSLGFPDQPGFRNSWAQAFIPYNVENRKPYSFLEVPMNFMDTSFKFYMKMEPHEAIETGMEFLDRFKSNALISILWHNNYFTDIKYEGYTGFYESILRWMHKEGLKPVTLKELYLEYFPE